MTLQVPITQFILPHGKKEVKMITVDMVTYNTAYLLINNNFSFASEILNNGSVVLYVCDDITSQDCDTTISMNGSMILDKFAKMLLLFDLPLHLSKRPSNAI